MTEATQRLQLPLIVPGQAGKEITHNEALALLDMLVQPVVVSAGATVPPANPQPGQAWIVGATPEGAWAGHPLAIAGWTAGGWRFVAAAAGMSAWVATHDMVARFDGEAWTIGALRGERLFIGDNPSIGVAQPSISDPSGGENIDNESRTSVIEILSVLRYHGLVRPPA